VGCGEKAHPDVLVRLAAERGRVVVDAARRRGGRGAWLHPSTACLERALRRRALGRALRREGIAADGEELGQGLAGGARRDEE